MKVADFEQRIQDALQDFGSAGSSQFNLEWKTIAQAKQLKSKIYQAQKQLRLIKKDVNSAKKAINVTYAAEIAKVGKDFGAAISTGVLGKKATGQSNASIKSQLRRRKARDLEPYERINRKIDGILSQFDQARLKINDWLLNQQKPAHAIAPIPPDEPANNQEVEEAPLPSSVTVASTDSTIRTFEPTEQSSSKAKVSTGKIAGIGFALIFGLRALATIGSDFFDGLAFIGLSLLCLPVLRIKSRTRFAAIALCMIFVNLTPPPVTSGASAPSVDAAVPSSSPPSPVATTTPSPTLSPSTAPTVSPDRPSASIISVSDGDTFRALIDGTETTVRLACIDAPESDQPHSNQSFDRLHQLLPRNAQIQLRLVDTDRYGRTVAEVYRDGQSINLQLVKEGYAVVYRDYLSGCPNETEYLAAEVSAKQQHLAFWSQAEPIMPWNWRNGQRPAPPTPVPPRPTPAPQSAPSIASNCDPSYPDLCIPPNSPDLDCSEIPHRRFRVVGGDPHRFDRDRDGIGCES